MKCALKRMYVNNEYDLQVCKREIQIMVSHRFALGPQTGSGMVREPGHLLPVICVASCCKQWVFLAKLSVSWKDLTPELCNHVKISY